MGFFVPVHQGRDSMKKDIYTNSLLACDDVFADIANVNLMPEGQQLQAEDLEEV